MNKNIAIVPLLLFFALTCLSQEEDLTQMISALAYVTEKQNLSKKTVETLMGAMLSVRRKQASESKTQNSISPSQRTSCVQSGQATLSEGLYSGLLPANQLLSGEDKLLPLDSYSVSFDQLTSTERSPIYETAHGNNSKIVRSDSAKINLISLLDLPMLEPSTCSAITVGMSETQKLSSLQTLSSSSGLSASSPSSTMTTEIGSDFLDLLEGNREVQHSNSLETELESFFPQDITIGAFPTTFTGSCSLSKKKAKQDSSLDQKEKSKISITCPYCDKSYLTKKTCNRHAKGCKNNPNRIVFSCSKCNKEFECKSSLKSHEAIHSDNPKHLCNWTGCKKAFYRRSTLKMHLRMHTGEKPFRCQWKDCRKSFSQKSHLTQHELRHAGKKRFQCTWGKCNWSFFRKKDLEDHMLVHTSKGAFRCEWSGCEKSFNYKSALITHMRTHTNERPYRCTWEECGSSFLQISHLKQHMKTHTSEKSFRCNICSTLFSTKAVLDGHNRYVKCSPSKKNRNQ